MYRVRGAPPSQSSSPPSDYENDAQNHLVRPKSSHSISKSITSTTSSKTAPAPHLNTADDYVLPEALKNDVLVRDAGLYVQQHRNQRIQQKNNATMNGIVHYRQSNPPDRAPPPRYPFPYMDSFAQTSAQNGHRSGPIAREYPVYDDTPASDRPSALDYHVYDEVPINAFNASRHLGQMNGANNTKNVNRSKAASLTSDPLTYESDSDDFMVSLGDMA